MPTIVETEVFTLDELAALGDDRAVERALDWMYQAWSTDAVEETSELLNEALADVFGPGRMTWDAWDYDRNYVNLAGVVLPAEMRQAGEGHALRGLAEMPGAGHIARMEYKTRATTDYGRCDGLWLYLTEDAPFSWADAEYDTLCEQVSDWLKDVEGRITMLMGESMEYLLSRERMVELCEMNGYTFTIDGRPFA